jgi:hypothetical protein
VNLVSIFYNLNVLIFALFVKWSNASGKPFIVVKNVSRRNANDVMGNDVNDVMKNDANDVMRNVEKIAGKYVNFNDYSLK